MLQRNSLREREREKEREKERKKERHRDTVISTLFLLVNHTVKVIIYNYLSL